MDSNGVVVVLTTIFSHNYDCNCLKIVVGYQDVPRPFSSQIMWLTEGLKHFEARFAFFDEIASKKF